jgi:hypothetical protein
MKFQDNVIKSIIAVVTFKTRLKGTVTKIRHPVITITTLLPALDYIIRQQCDSQLYLYCCMTCFSNCQLMMRIWSKWQKKFILYAKMNGLLSWGSWCRLRAILEQRKLAGNTSYWQVVNPAPSGQSSPFLFQAVRSQGWRDGNSVQLYWRLPQCNLPAGWLAGLLTAEWLAYWLNDCKAGQLIDWLTNWLNDCIAGQLIDWLTE